MTDNGVDTEPGHWSGNDSRKVFNFQFPFEYLWHRWLVPLIVFRWASGGKGVWREVSLTATQVAWFFSTWGKEVRLSLAMMILKRSLAIFHYPLSNIWVR